jgi:hypothetical protein
LYFSCSRTTTASDGPSGGHSPFAEALLDEQHGFFAEGVTLQDAIANVSRAGEKEGQQKPVEYAIPTTIPRHFCIRPLAGGAHAGPAGEQQTGAVLAPTEDTREIGRWMRTFWRCCGFFLEVESEHLAENGVRTMKALEIMIEQDM